MKQIHVITQQIDEESYLKWISFESEAYTSLKKAEIRVKSLRGKLPKFSPHFFELESIVINKKTN